MWKSTDGVAWTKSSENGFGDSNNRYVTSTAVFHNSLFVGTWNQVEGCEIWATPVPVVQVALNIDPDSINLKSNGQWITCYIELPTDYDPDNIDLSTILINRTIPVDMLGSTRIEDHDVNGVPDLMVKFNRAEVISWLSIRDFGEDTGKSTEIILQVTGLVEGIAFEGFDIVRVLLKV